ncbi:DNA translocase FtsK, partial [Bacillus sp. P14.5]
FILTQETASTSMIQRRFRIGYNRAARLIDSLEQAGYVGPSEGSKPRKVLINQPEA